MIYGSRPIGWPKRVEVQALSTVIVYIAIISVMTISQKKKFSSYVKQRFIFMFGRLLGILKHCFRFYGIQPE